MIRAIIGWWKRHQAAIYRDWAHVPPPEWAAKRGWRDYW